MTEARLYCTISPGDFMITEEFFKSCCRELSKGFDCELYFKKLIKTKESKTEDGVAARFCFDGYYIDISYIRKGSFAVCPDILWVSAGFDGEENVPFSVYDLFGIFGINDFRCFTPAYISEEKLMAECFKLYGRLFYNITLLMNAAVKNGVVKNNVLKQQKQYICDFCGSDIIYDTSNNFSEQSEKIIGLLISGFVTFEIREAVTGAQSLFYNGEAKKAKKRYKKKKYKSRYDLLLEEYIEKGGDAPENTLTESVKTSEKELKKVQRNEVVFILLLALLINIPVCLFAYGLYYVLSGVMFKDAVFICGLNLSNGLEAVIGAFPLSLCITLHIFPKLRYKKDKNKKTDIPTFLRYFTALAECGFLLFVYCAVNSSAVFYEDCLKYSSKDVLNLTQQEYSYNKIEKITKVEKVFDEVKNDYVYNPYYILELKNGETVNLYYVTNGNTEKIEEKLLPFLKEKGIKEGTAISEPKK